MATLAGQDYLADFTEKFSGADLTEICQRAVKLAIRESIEMHMEAQRLWEAAGDMGEVVETEDPVPNITPRHFELAMREVSAWVCASV